MALGGCICTLWLKRLLGKRSTFRYSKGVFSVTIILSQEQNDSQMLLYFKVGVLTPPTHVVSNEYSEYQGSVRPLIAPRC